MILFPVTLKTMAERQKVPSLVWLGLGGTWLKNRQPMHPDIAQPNISQWNQRIKSLTSTLTWYINILRMVSVVMRRRMFGFLILTQTVMRRKVSHPTIVLQAGF